MKMQKIMLILFSCVLLAAVLYQFKFDKQHKDDAILVVGTSLDYPPYEFIDHQTQQPVGLDIDMVSEIAARLNKTLIIKNMPFTSLIFGLLTGSIDMIAAGISPTERRAKLVSFSDQYLKGQPFVVLTKTVHLQPNSMQDLQDKVVAVSTGYIMDLYMSKEHPSIELIRLKSPAECFMAVQTGMVDAFVSGSNTVATFLQHIQNPENFSVMQIPDTGEPCSFAVAKNNKKLLEQINQALMAMTADGMLEKIKEKWGF